MRPQRTQPSPRRVSLRFHALGFASAPKPETPSTHTHTHRDALSPSASGSGLGLAQVLQNRQPVQVQTPLPLPSHTPLALVLFPEGLHMLVQLSWSVTPLSSHVVGKPVSHMHPQHRSRDVPPTLRGPTEVMIKTGASYGS